MGFFDAIKRRRLAQKGMSSGKKRRVQNDASVIVSLDSSPWVRYALYLVFCVAVAVAVMRGLAAEDEVRGSLTVAKYAFLIALSGAVIVELNLELVGRRNTGVILLFGVILGQLALMRGFGLLVEANDLSLMFGFVLTPFVLAPMIHSVLLGRAAGILSTIYASLLGAMLMPGEGKGMFLAVSLLCGLVVVRTLGKTRKRAQLLRAGFYSGLMVLVLAVLLGVIDLVAVLQSGSAEEWREVGLASLVALGTGITIALLVSGCLPVLEGFFGLTTDISWLELADLNHRLLRQMQLEAPGTFHHSLVVASLAEAAAEAVGANAVMCRVGAYFHDIGKLNKPEYFIENQHDGAENPHNSLTPTMSALIIVAHVKDGVDMALKNKLHPQVIDVIKEHHGDSLVSFFHRKAREQKKTEQEKVEKGLENPEDLPKVDEKNFRYPGPRPRSRESGIISLADAVESASRSLKKPTPAKIRVLVEELVELRICDGQLDECLLTVKDLATVKGVFSSTLRSMLHSRIAYPKDEEKGRKSDLNRLAEGERKANESKESAGKGKKAVAKVAEKAREKVAEPIATQVMKSTGRA